MHQVDDWAMILGVFNALHWSVDALLFSSIGVASSDGERSVEILVTGILLFHVVWQLTLAGSMYFLEEVWSRNVLNLFTTPLHEREYAGALGIVGLARTVVASTLVGLVGLVLYATDPSAAGWVLVPGAVILLIFGWAVSLLVIGMTLQYGDSAEVFSWGVLVLLMPLSGVFYPVEALPPILQPIAEMIPPLWRRIMNPRVKKWRAMYYPEITDWRPYDRHATPLPR